ncbi:MAG: PepSY domain-containing protein [Methyloceanibacter sp.]|uniref:PepSY domain-containing protein n=1 Tax=Methyloceanibacter sp. TaxID=1965321 RepID=UPI003EDF5B0C
MRLMPVVLALGVSLGFAAPASAAYVDIETVRAMAFDRGIVKLDEIELKRRKGIWEVEGEDAYGEEIEMEIDARTGRIIKMKRD